MGFKLSQPNFHNSDQENVDEVIRSLDVQQKPLDEDVIAEANNDGSMYIDDNVDIYSEEGKVLFTNNNNNMGELPFTRKYLYEFNDENLFSANVSFFIPSVKSEHLKYFHTMQLLNDGKTFDLEDHPCVDDMYHAEMNLVSNDEFFICWNVTGPNKNYRIETNYFRMMDESTSMMKNDATTTPTTPRTNSKV